MSKEYHRQRRKRKKFEDEFVVDTDSSSEDNIEQIVDNSLVSSFNGTSYIESGFEFDTSIEEEGTDEEDGYVEEEENVADDIDNEEGISLRDNLASWACRNNLSRSCVNELLEVLRQSNLDLPKDARTLLQTPKHVEIKDKFGGKFIYLGIKDEMERFILKNNLTSNDTVFMNVNVDGLPLFKSSNQSVWPILGHFSKFENPFIVAIFCGSSKPNNVSGYMESFLAEYEKLSNEGISVNDSRYFLKVNAVICDAPARQFLKCTKAHNSYSACERCVVQGEYVERRMTFNGTNNELRTSEKFSTMYYINHQVNQSPLIQSSIDPIKDFPLDYMHLVLLGTVRRLLLFCKEGPKICKISNRQVQEISSMLCELRKSIPSDLARQPRTLDELKRWKATEFRQFLLFTGPLVLKGVVDDEIYFHFLTLSTAMRVFLESNNEVRNHYKNYAKDLLVFFVQKAPTLYGNTFVTFNIHSLIHLFEDVEYFNTSLDNISAFPFENFMQCIKRSVRNANNPVSQIVKRIQEIELTNSQRLKKYLYTKISTNQRDSWFMLLSKDVVLIKQQLENHNFRCHFYQHKDLLPYYTRPCDSTIVNVYRLCKAVKYTIKNVSKELLYRKLFSVELKSGDRYLCTLLHDVQFKP